jgi:hypothetical protein
MNGALQDAGVGQIKLITFRFQQAAGILGLLDACGGEVDIGPASEAIFKIPGGLAVANQNEFIHIERLNLKRKYKLPAVILEFESGMQPSKWLLMNFLRVFCEFFD